jgi:hypothetical protein
MQWCTASLGRLLKTGRNCVYLEDIGLTPDHILKIGELSSDEGQDAVPPYSVQDAR